MERQFKRINEVFTIEEHKQLVEKKEKLGIKNWHDLILLLLGVENGQK